MDKIEITNPDIEYNINVTIGDTNTGINISIPSAKSVMEDYLLVNDEYRMVIIVKDEYDNIKNLFEKVISNKNMVPNNIIVNKTYLSETGETRKVRTDNIVTTASYNKISECFYILTDDDDNLFLEIILSGKMN